MRRFLFIVFFLLILIPAALIIFAPLIPLDRFAPQIEAQIEKVTGLPVTLGGKLRVQILPSIAVNANDITIDNHPDFAASYDGAPTLLKLESLSLNLSLSHLLNKTIKVESVTLKSPEINVLKTADGQFNWMAKQVDGFASIEGATTSEPIADDIGDPSELLLDSLEITDALVTYWDLATGVGHKVTNLNVEVASLDANERTLITYDLSYMDEPISGNVAVQSLSDLLSQQEADIIALVGGDFGSVEVRTAINLSDLDVISADIDVRELRPSVVTKLAGAEEHVEGYQGLLTGVASGTIQVTKIGDQLDVALDKLAYQLGQNQFGFVGSLTQIAGTLALIGDLQASSTDVASVINLANLKVDGIDQLGTLNMDLRSGLTLVGDQLSLDDLSVSTSGDEFFLDITGDAAVSGTSPNADLEFSGNINKLSSFAEIAQGFSNDPRLLQVLSQSGSLVTSGQVAYTGTDASLSGVNLDVRSPLGEVVYAGDLANLMTTPKVDGRFRLDAPAIAPILDMVAPTLVVDRAAFNQSMEGVLQVSADVAMDNTSVRLDGLSSSIQGPQINTSFSGRVSADTETGELDLVGDLRSNLTSARQLAQTFGVELPGEPQVFQATSVNGRLYYQPNQIRIQDAEIVLDDIRSGLNFEADLQGQRPRFGIGFAADQVALDPYLGTGQAASGQLTSEQPATSRTIESNWSDEPIDVSVLRNFDLELTAVVNGLSYSGYEFGRTEVTAKVDQGIADINLPEASIFGGQTGASLRVNAQQQTLSFALTGNLKGVRAKAALERLLRIDRVDGVANLAVDVTSAGASEAQIMNNLSGTARADINEGALLGFDLRQTVANARKGILTPVKGPSHKTNFSTASVGFNLNQGIAQSQEIKFWSPILKVSGQGQMDLRTRQMNLSLPIELGVFRQDGSAETQTLTLPLFVAGPWHDPSIRLDGDQLLQSFLQNPDAFLGLLPDGLGLDKLFKDGANVQQVIQQQRQKVEQKAQEEIARVEQKAAEEFARVQQQAQQKLQEEAARAAEKLTQKLGQQVGNEVTNQAQGVINSVIGDPNVQQKLEQEAGNLLNSIFGN